MAEKNSFASNIILIGMMATGKSAIGKELEDRMNMKFIDTDRLVEEKVGMPVAEIFKRHGEDCFRDYESEIIDGLKNYTPGSLVVATGGGAVIREKNRSNLSRAGLVVLLKASPEEIVKRVSKEVRKNGGRPLLDVNDPEAAVRALLEERKPCYNCCDICVNTDNKSIEELVEETIGKIKYR